MNNSYSVKVTIRTDKVLQNGNCPIIIRVIINSKQKKYYVKESINPEFWDMVNCRAIGKNFKHLNIKLKKLESDLVGHCSLKESGNVPITFSLIDSFYRGKNDNDFYDVFDDIVAKKDLMKDTEYKYKLLRERLKDFQSNIFTSDVDYNLIKKFDSYLKCKEIGVGGLHNHHKCLKSIINEAIRLDKMIKSPYSTFKFKALKSKEVFLEEFEVVKIKDLKFTTIERSKYSLSRDIFLFACYTGFRYSDCINLKVKDVDFKKSNIEIVMIKTGEKLVFPFNSQTKGLLVRYLINKKADENVFPLITNQVLNRNLKDIAGLAEINKVVTCHVARHTFASYLLNCRNVPMPTVSKLLGHTNMSNTMIYTNTNCNILKNTINEIRYGIKP